MAERWFYLVDRESDRPVDFETPARLAASGELPRETIVWKDGFPA